MGGSKQTIKKRRLNKLSTMAEKQEAIEIDDLRPPPIQTRKKTMAVKHEVIEIDDSDSNNGGSKQTIKKRRLNKLSTMAEKQEAIEIDDLRPPPIQTRKKTMAVKHEVIEIDDSDSSPSPVRTGTPLRPIFCLKNREEIEKFEEEEECFILEFDPYNDSDVLKLTNGPHDFNAESELSIVAEKGQVACRDFPHPRNACAVFPFEKTPHDKHCKMCHCYVCDLSAPCSKWTGTSGHCHAFNNEGWNSEKQARRIFTKAV